jgi:hypothetical protein
MFARVRKQLVDEADVVFIVHEWSTLAQQRKGA